MGVSTTPAAAAFTCEPALPRSWCCLTPRNRAAPGTRRKNGAGVLIAGLAWVFTWYLAAVAALPLAIAADREAFARYHWGP